MGAWNIAIIALELAENAKSDDNLSNNEIIMQVTQKKLAKIY